MILFVFRILTIMQSGLIKKSMKHHWPMEGNKCDKFHSKVSHTRPSLSDTFGAFFVLGVGITGSIFVFILELTVHKSREILLRISERKEEISDETTLATSTVETNTFQKFRSIYSQNNLLTNNFS